jgi:hypothetical protein
MLLLVEVVVDQETVAVIQLLVHVKVEMPQFLQMAQPLATELIQLNLAKPVSARAALTDWVVVPQVTETLLEAVQVG